MSECIGILRGTDGKHSPLSQRKSSKLRAEAVKRVNGMNM